jgi:hypothetical protein
MTSPSDARAAFERRHAEMRQNAGDWVIKNRNALGLCQSVLLSKYYEAVEELSENDNHDPDFCCFLSEIEDAIDLLGSTIADLRGQRFWPDPAPTTTTATEINEQSVD